jgi:hypothetical protein
MKKAKVLKAFFRCKESRETFHTCGLSLCFKTNEPLVLFKKINGKTILASPIKDFADSHEFVMLETEKEEYFKISLRTKTATRPLASM